MNRSAGKHGVQNWFGTAAALFFNGFITAPFCRSDAFILSVTIRPCGLLSVRLCTGGCPCEAAQTQSRATRSARTETLATDHDLLRIGLRTLHRKHVCDPHRDVARGTRSVRQVVGVEPDSRHAWNYCVGIVVYRTPVLRQLLL